MHCTIGIIQKFLFTSFCMFSFTYTCRINDGRSYWGEFQIIIFEGAALFALTSDTPLYTYIQRQRLFRNAFVLCILYRSTEPKVESVCTIFIFNTCSGTMFITCGPIKTSLQCRYDFFLSTIYTLKVKYQTVIVYSQHILHSKLFGEHKQTKIF